jgi:peptidyl-dipeptidase Dcp
MSNPLLKKSTLPFEAVPFDQINIDHYMPALDTSLATARENIEKIKSNSDEPTFENTILALEDADELMSYVTTVYFNVKHANGTEEFHALAKEMMPKIVTYESDVTLDPAVFARVKTVYENMGSLDSESQMLVEKTFLSYKRNGASLSEEQKKDLRSIDDQLSTLNPQFSENMLKSTNEYFMHITDESEVAGLPESALVAAQEEAKGRSLEGWVFTCQAPSLIPFMKYADSESHRKELYLAFNTRAVCGKYDNSELVKKISTLKCQRAQLLGYDTFAHYTLEERMAESPAVVTAFLDNLAEVSRPAAENELTEVKEFKKENGGGEGINHWDLNYWSNKLKEDRYNFDTEILRPYFKLENSMEGVFEHASRLFDLKFEQINDVPVYHEDVNVYKVTHKNGDFMGLLYGDFFPRETKQAGAWCTRFRAQWKEGDKNIRPHASIVCNFTKPTADKPSLLTLNEVNTLFHEFGHALHSLLSQVTYKTLSCTSVFRDFVELPSQIFENWLKEKESLALFAKHYETGDIIPDKYIEKIKETENFQAATFMMRQLYFGAIDMAWYGIDPSSVEDVVTHENKMTAATSLLPPAEGTSRSCSFGHIFGGGYSAGYYGYKWAEVLDADAFEYFKEEGIFSKKVADKFRTCILEKGGSAHPMELYKAFRGREPDPKALLRRNDLI